MYQGENPDGPERSVASYERDLAEASKTNKCVNGIKGPSMLNRLSFYHPIYNTNIDSMHSVFLGAIKTLFRFWFEIENDGSLIQEMETIDNRLKCIRPPKFIPNTPMSIYTWKKWRAKEYMVFVLYYVIPIFNGSWTPIITQI